MASDMTVEILKDIRDEIRGVRGEQIQTNQRLDLMTQRIDLVETTLLDPAEQQRFVIDKLESK